MRTGILAASFAALLAVAYGGPTGGQSDTSDKHINAVRAVDDASLDTVEHMNTDVNLRIKKFPQVRNNFPGAPPCGDWWYNPPGPNATDHEINLARDSASKGEKFPTGHKHWICNYAYVLCIRLPVEAQQQNDGFWQIARWKNNGDGTDLLALKYWQESILWKTTGGSAKLYAAHGSVWGCAKGNVNWLYEFDKNWAPSPFREHSYYLRGNSRLPDDFDHNTAIGQASWGGPCHCGFNLNVDLTMTISK